MMISNELIEQKSEEYKKKYSLIDKALFELFESMNQNTSLEEILIKVTALNSLYSTNISGYKNLEMISKIIYESRNMDELIDAGDKEAVNIIGQTREGMNNAFVFASKYCSFHQPEKFLIFDSYSWFALRTICGELGIDHKLKSNPTMDFDAYNKYCKCVDNIINEYGLIHDYKKIDEFLWMKGKTLLMNQ